MKTRMKNSSVVGAQDCFIMQSEAHTDVSFFSKQMNELIPNVMGY